MNNDFEPIFIDLPKQDFTVYCIADVHLGAAECDIDGFKKLLNKIEQDKNAYLVIVGDLIDNATRSSVGDIYEGLNPREQINLAISLLEPIKNRVLAGVSGNHEMRTYKETSLDPMGLIFWQLGIEDKYRTNTAFLRLRINDATGTVRQSVSFCLVHGKSANKRKNFSYALEGVDVLVTGHTHDGAIDRPSHIVFSQKGNVYMRDVISVVATSWLRYDLGGYAVANLYMPKATSCPQYIQVHLPEANQRPELSVVW